MSLPLFAAPIYEYLSLNFQKIVLQLGDSVAGDEKLFHFTGNSYSACSQQVSSNWSLVLSTVCPIA
jgi:hypothetical protein